MNKSINAHLEDDTNISFDELHEGCNSLKLGNASDAITIFFTSEQQRKKMIQELSKLEIKEK